jgi:NTE family protein
MNQLAQHRRRLMAKLGAIGALFAVPMAAQAQTPASGSARPPRPAANPATNQNPAKFAVVFGSGSARGFAHIGVIKAFDAAGIKPHMIVGTSAGSVVGALWAAGLTGLQIEDIALKVKDAEIIDLTAQSKRGLVGGDSIENLINQIVKKKTIEQLPIKFAAVATVLRTGEASVMQQGDVGFAVRASCSIPGVFLPAKRGEIEYLDGGLVSPLPVKTAKDLGADWVVAVDVNSSKISALPQGIFEQIMHSFDIMGRALSRLESDQAAIVLRPDLSRIASTDFASRSVTIQLGFLEGQKMVPVILEKMAQMNSRKR